MSSNDTKSNPVPPAGRSSHHHKHHYKTNIKANKQTFGNGNSEKRQIVGQYMLGKTIGEGTFGKVKLAVHIPTGEKVAVKILEKNRIKEAADVRRVNREIKILKKARHFNVIQLYEVLDTQNTIYLIMECCEGGEMFDFIVQQKHVPELQAVKFFHQLVDGVDVLHLNEITHRDLKPENLLLKSSPEGWIVKIVDFGLSNTHEGGRYLSTACGSPCYAAPEMIAGKKYFGPSADIWSMGVILFALVCGYLPFEDSNTSVLYRKILSGEYRPARWISNEVRDLLRHVLEVDPAKRYTLEDIRKHPWYTQVHPQDIPKEGVNPYDDESTRNETLAILAASGIDSQSVMDGLSSKACNSLTAMYFLFEQKHRQRNTNQQKSHTEIVVKQSPLVIPPIANPNPSPVAGGTSVSNPNTPAPAAKGLLVPIKPYLQAPGILTPKQPLNAIANMEIDLKSSRPEVPKLAVRAVIPAVLTSQTARGPAPAPGLAPVMMTPMSARAALGTEEDKPKKSLRSPDAAAAGIVPHAPAGARPSVPLDPVPQAAAPLQPLHRPAQPGQPVQAPQAAQPVQAPSAGQEAPVPAAAPSAPAAPSASAPPGGRRGRHLVSSAPTADTTADSAASAAPAAAPVAPTTFQDARSDAQRNRMVNQGAAAIIS